MVRSYLDYSKGFGGKFGVEKDKVDKAALGYDYKADTEKHQSQKGAHALAPAHNTCQCFGGADGGLALFRLFRRFWGSLWGAGRPHG